MEFYVTLRNGLRVNGDAVMMVRSGVGVVMEHEAGRDVYLQLLTNGRIDFRDHPAIGILEQLGWTDDSGMIYPVVASVVHATAAMHNGQMFIVNPVLPEEMYYSHLSNYNSN